MENASKALIMAGGMLLAILIISLLIYAWSLFSKYQASKDELDNIEDTAKFNEQFTNYDRDGVQGYELLSLVNKIIDYNYRKSKLAEAKNDEKYTNMTIVINMGDDGKRKKLTKDQNLRVFTGATYTQSNTQNAFGTIKQNLEIIENQYGGSEYATKLAKGIDGIILTEDQLRQNENKGISRDASKIAALKKYNASTNGTKYNDYQTMVNAQKNNLYKYYEYMQFKRSLFNSSSKDIQYDNATGRITKMVFNFDKVY